MRIGSLCTGYGGLELAISLLGWNTRLAWVADNDPAVAAALNARFPGVPNLGDITTAQPDPVDIITAGFPCQPLSQAGKQKGTDDDRWLWPAIQDLLSRMDPPPRMLLLENVPRLLTINDGNAMAQVVEGLASLGYMGRYRLLRASDIGACHQRNRWFCIATNTNESTVRPKSQSQLGRSHQTEPRYPLLPTPAAWDGARGPDYARARERQSTHGSGGDDLTTAVAKRLLPTPMAADGTGGKRHKEGTYSATGQRDDGSKIHVSLTDALQCLPTPTASEGKRESQRYGGGNPTLIGALLPTPIATDARSGRNRDGDGRLYVGNTGGTTLTEAILEERWGDYTDAVRRQATATRAMPPSPVTDGRRLNPAFVEWMMMLPPGWVTDLDLPRTAQLRILGNGVVPAQAAAAFAALLGEGG